MNLAVCLLAAAVVASPAVAHARQAPSAPATDDRQRTDVAGAFAASINLLLIEHGTRVAFQDKTRRELGGSFFGDYRRSLRVPRKWEDDDPWWVNYVGHPLHGAAAGYLWLDHDPNAETERAFSRRYWANRGRAAAWIAAYSVQFEFGPISEASIGNVGLDPRTTGWVDHVVTPVGGLGWLIAEDALDHYFVRWVEQRTTNKVWRASLRLLFNPSRTLSNTAQGRLPWHRPDRNLSWR